MKCLLVTTIALITSLMASAFSPYENYLLSDRTTVVGLIAEIGPGKTGDLSTAIEALGTDSARRSLAASGIENVRAFTYKIGEHEWVVLHFLYDGKRDYLQAASAFESACEETAALTELTRSHPRAERLETHWLQMEWITYIRGKNVPGPADSQVMLVTTVRPDKEEDYRTLHQTVWPGVVDQVARSNNRNLSIYLAELDGKLVEFLYLEYVGDAPQADNKMSETDAINHRWWKKTDACQEPLPGVKDIWGPMTPLNP